ncbi:hypothetical protein [Aquidulcibacter paucihalophilus]|uniref:hypothetical protein n=1 Tax=Aquidulcibacter paucihalophilus TaxID=1978549 RepID=UPI000A18ED8E|nr:hypothetical protein [Aquidulcibacter paucihalophilus]
MRKSNLLTALLATSNFGWAAPAYAGEVVLEYRIPKAAVGFAVSHMITKCPDDAGRGFAMDIVTGIVPVYGPGETVKVNASGSLFVDRQVELEFHPNGTLKSFNGGSEGQGGPLIVAAIKVASVAAAASTGTGIAAASGAAPTAAATATQANNWVCHKWVKDALSAKEAAQGRLDSLKHSVANTRLTEALAAEIGKTEALIAAIDARLTVAGEPVKWAPSSTSLSYAATAESGDLSVWFIPAPTFNLDKALREAGYGQLTQFSVTGSGGLKAPPKEVSKKPAQSLVFRRLVAANVAIEPAAAFDAGTKLDAIETALAQQRYEATKQTLAVMIPQLGQLVEVPFGNSGLFGTRAVSASFSEAGALSSIGYTNKGGAQALADVTSAVADGAVELRSARLNAINREIDLRTQEKALRELIIAEVKKDE